MQPIVDSVCPKIIEPRNVFSSPWTSVKPSRASTTPTLDSCPHVRTVRTTVQPEKNFETGTSFFEAVPPRKQKHLVSCEKLFLPAATSSQEPKELNIEGLSGASDIREPEAVSLTLSSALLARAKQRASDYKTLTMEKNGRSTPL